MSPPDLNSLPPSCTNTTSSATLSISTPATTTTTMIQPTTPRRHPPHRRRTNNDSTDSGIIPFPRTMSMASQENYSPGFGSPARGLSESPRLSVTSLQAAAAVNAGLRSEEDSRRSSVGSITRQRSTRSPHSTARRRSTVLMNLQLNDPTLPAPGEMVNEPQLPHLTSYNSMSALNLSNLSSLSNLSNLARGSPRSSASPIIPSRDPAHNRAPSLGEIHQELEQEQEAQVNRLLQMIRVQQAALQALQASQSNPVAADEVSPSNTHLATILSAGATPSATPADSPGASATSVSPAATSAPAQPIPIPTTTTAMPIRQGIYPRSSFDLSRSVRTGSRTPSRNASPGLPLRSPSIGPMPMTPNYSGVSGGMGGMGRQQSEEWLGGVCTRDEAMFWKAEAQMMTRENQMLRLRIRELEREFRERSEGGGTPRRGSGAYEPTTPSSLTRVLSATRRRGSGREGRDGRDSGLGSRQDRVSEMGQGEEEEDASPRTTPAPKAPSAETFLAKHEKEVSKEEE